MNNANALLSLKFTPAELPEVYAPRKELLSMFHTKAVGRFIYVSAPAGSGKTVSARLWLAESGRKSIWIGLDEYDNAPVVFYKQLATGFFSLQPDNKNMHATLTDNNFSATPVEHTIKLIAEMRPDFSLYAIVLDDAHLITNSEIIKSLPAVLERVPGSFVTIILSREPMPEKFRRIIPVDCVIETQHLRFSPEEIRLYYKSLGGKLSQKEAEFAFAATDGLAIGVNAITMSGSMEFGKGANIFARYFEDNIWNTWDERTRNFCLNICVADEFTPELARLLTGFDDAGEIMKRLSASNAFLSHLREDIYRFHHLFQEFLRDKARRESINVSALYKKAAEYYKEHGDYSMALRFWLNSGDYKGADTFLFLFMFENNRGNIAEYVHFLRIYFIRDFPDKAFTDFPALHVCCAWYYYMTSNYKEYEKHADAGYKQIIKIAKCHAKFVEFAMLMYSVDHRSRLADKLKRFGAFGKLIKRFTNEGIIRNIASATHDLPYMHRSSFDYCDAHDDPKFLDKVRKSFFMHLLGDQGEFMLRLSEAGFFYEQNDLQRALTATDWLLNKETEQHSIELRVCLRLLRHSILLDSGKDAGAAFNALAELVGQSAQFFLPNLEAYKTKLALLGCDKNAARVWLENYFVVDANHIELYLVFQHFTTARAYIVLGDYDKAYKYAVMLRDFGQNLTRICDYGEASVLLSALEWTAGKKKDAVAILENALEKLQKYGLIRIVADEGNAVIPVLKRILNKTGKQDYNGNLQNSFVNKCLLSAYAVAKKYKGITADFIRQRKTVKLSKQQSFVLTLLSRGYTYKKIMEETGLKMPTVKAHITLAYEKLNANNRLEAVLKAQELGLIES